MARAGEARVLMVQGTASSVGKSLIVAGLCRWLRRAGFHVAPFKAQNMALNAYVTPDGREIGRAQAVQAEAAEVAATVDMNPILLKPEGDSASQVIVLGEVVGRMTATEYYARKAPHREVIAGALARLRAEYEVVVVEGAGSPAEINLRQHDIVNMHVAREADAPVLLVGDIDRGGVFASLVGTMELLDAEDRARVAGFVVNKFRGDVGLLEPGLRFLEERTGIPVAGVVPYLRSLRIADEDSVSLEERRTRRPARADQIEIAVVDLPRISNFDDVQPLEHLAGVVVRVVDTAAAVARADLAIVPGTKSTVADLAWLRARGIDAALVERAARGAPVLGICGGCQILGASIDDPDGAEAAAGTSVDGLGLLPLRTRFERRKTTARVEARPARAGWLWDGVGPAPRLSGYEIHMGAVTHADEGSPAFVIESRNGRPASVLDGASTADGAVVGTMIHGLFENAPVRGALLAALRRRRGAAPPPGSTEGEAQASKDAEYDSLARALHRALRHDVVARCLGVDAARLAAFAD